MFLLDSKNPRIFVTWKMHEVALNYKAQKYSRWLYLLRYKDLTLWGPSIAGVASRWHNYFQCNQPRSRIKRQPQHARRGRSFVPRMGGDKGRWEEGENGRKPGGWDKDDAGPRRRSRAAGSKKFLSPIPLSALRLPRTSCPIFILVFGLHPRSSWEETFLMNVRGLKG